MRRVKSDDDASVDGVGDSGHCDGDGDRGGCVEWVLSMLAMMIRITIQTFKRGDGVGRCD